MIKINLLENHLSVPETKPKAAREHTEETVIRKEAKKSSRFLLRLIILFIILIAGGIASYIFRYEIIAFAEQYTGPLNILAPVEPEISSEQLEEMRRDKIRTQYMANTYDIQFRNHLFLSRVDSMDQSNEQFWISSLILDVNDFKIEIYGKKENAFTEFTKQLVLTSNVETVKPLDSKATSVMRGYFLKKMIQGSLKVIGESPADKRIPTVFYAKDTIINKMNELARKTGVKLQAETQIAQNKGVIMNKFRGKARAEGMSQQLMLFLKTFTDMKLNCEWVSYNLTYSAPSGKKKNQPDVLLMDYEIFIPNKLNGSSAASSSSTR